MQVFTWKRISSFALAAVAAAMMLWPSLPPEQVWAETENGSDSSGYTVSNEDGLNYALNSGEKEIIVKEEIILSNTLIIPSGTEIVLYGAEDGSSSIKASTNNSVLIDVGGTLTTKNLTMDAASKGTALKVEESGSYQMESGTVLKNGNGNKTGEYGGGIWNKGICRISGGTITGCSASYGGGIANLGTLTMNGGSVVNCSAKRGGGIYNKGSEAVVTIDGADVEISTNDAHHSMNTVDTSAQGVSCGGGIYIQSGSVTLKDGKISDNQARADTSPSFGAGTEGLGGAIGCGGGVYVDNYGGSFVMTGGTVSGNKATWYSSNISFLSEAKREMRGGGVFVQGGTDETAGKQAGTFTMTGGSITGNYARSGYGGGVCVAEKEYNYLDRSESSHCPGAAGIFLGGSAKITGNLNSENLYLCRGVSAVIAEPFKEDADISVNVEGMETDTVLAEYAQGVKANESDSGLFTLSLQTDLRTVKLRELLPEEGQDGDVRYQLYMAGFDISEYGTVILEDESTVYTGEAIEPKVTEVQFYSGSGKTLLLSKDTDYRVDYEYESGKNTEPGPAKVVVTGIGNYSGQITVPFEIQKRPVDDPAVEVTKNELASVSYTYNGKEQTPVKTLIALEDMVTGKPLGANVHYSIDYESNVNAGTGYVLLNGAGDYYSGTRKLPFTIEPASLDGCSFTYSKSHQYTGQAIEPAVTVKDVKNGLGELKEGTDYTCTYRNNINVGTETAEIIVTGKGNYTGTRTLKFSILASTASTTSTAAAQQISGPKATYQKVYGAKAFSLNVKASGGGTLSYTSSDKNVVTVNSKGTVTVKGTGKATITVKATAVGQQYKACEKTVTVTVLPKKAAGVSVSNSKAKKLTVKWKKDKQATGYEVQYSTSKKFKQSNTKTKNVGKNTTVKKTISKLKKGKTYCVRVRSYKKYGKEKLYGAWSSVCKITVFQ